MGALKISKKTEKFTKTFSNPHWLTALARDWPHARDGPLSTLTQGGNKR